MTAPPRLPRLLLPLAIALLLAVLGTALVFAAFLFPSRQKTTAELLPARETVALFHNLTTEDAERFAPRFPILQEIPLPREGGTDVAIVRHQNGKYGWVVFLTGEAAKAVSSRFPLDTEDLVVRGSSGALALLARPNVPSLAKLADYRTLVRLAPQERTWLFLSGNVILSGITEEDRQLLQRLKDHPSLLIQWEDTRATLSFVSPALGAVRLSMPPPALEPSPSFSAAFTHPQRTTEDLASLFSPAASLLLEGIVQREWERLIGTEASGRYDLLPLLGREASVSVLRSQSGSLRFLLQTHTQDPDAAKRIDRLHRSVKQALSTQRIVSRNLPEGFAVTTIEDDPAVINEVRSQSGAWAMRMTRRTDTGEGLWTATNGRRLFLSN
ncbi:MAG: hypothetical protein AAB728_03880, partial [Patescibacteria group bacterium]